jgi:prephenate dehydrogenase
VTKLFDRMVIAGVGLIGGSLGLAARARGLVGESVGYGRGEENLRIAERRGAVDRYSLTPADAAHDADLIVLAVPVRSLAPVAVDLLPHARPGAVVIDVGSVKASVVAALDAVVLPPSHFVGCHPVAGTEHSGAANALPDLFEGQLCILTPTPATDRTALERIRVLWEGLGMRVEIMQATDHDRLLGLVSHLPHVVAYALINAIESARVAGRDPLAYSGGGLRDTTRIASSHPGMWRDIFLDNRAEVLRTIDEFRDELDRLRDSIERQDDSSLEAALERSRVARARVKDPRS